MTTGTSQAEGSSTRAEQAGRDRSLSVSVAVEARSLTKLFGTNRAVDDVDLTVMEGEIFGVLGPNGAGKTTMLNMLATLLTIDGGQARIFGYDVRSEGHAVRQLIGVTGQFASVDENLTARENLWLFGRLQGLSSKNAHSIGDDLLEQFDLMKAARRPISQFSGGMRRRLDLAASLITRPALIFLDEPTTGLDPRTRSQMWDTIRDLVAQGSTIMLTTQYLDERTHSPGGSLSSITAGRSPRELRVSSRPKSAHRASVSRWPGHRHGKGVPAILHKMPDAIR